MHCDTCGKDSTNRRVCPHCFTPYPEAEQGPGRRTGSQPRVPGVTPPAGGATGSGTSPRPSGERSALSQSLEHAARDTREFVMRQTPTVRWAGLGILVMLLLWAFTGDDGQARTNVMDAPGTPVAGDSLPPMTYEQAVAYVQHTRSTALVEVHSEEVFVNFAGATFPLTEEGQVALVRRFAQADEIVEGKRRRIYFYNPAGRLFAQSDRVTGVTLKR